MTYVNFIANVVFYFSDYVAQYRTSCYITQILTAYMAKVIWTIQDDYRLPHTLTGPQLVKKLPAFYGTRRFITAFTTTRHLSLSWATSIQSTPPHPTSRRSFLILSSHLSLGLPSRLIPSGLPTNNLYASLLSQNVLHAMPISFFFIWSTEQYFVRSTEHEAHNPRFLCTNSWHTNTSMNQYEIGIKLV
jgi:hypothetical protein